MAKLDSINLSWMTKRLHPFTGPSVFWGMGVQLTVGLDKFPFYSTDFRKVWGMKLGMTLVESPQRSELQENYGV